MMAQKTDVVIIGAGPVGLMCAYLGRLCNLEVVIIDKSLEPLQVGRADALNARTLQLFESVGLFDQLHPLGKPCNTSSVWADGKFVSRKSAWWDELEGCFHKYYLMLGQSFVEQALDERIKTLGCPVHRQTSVRDIKILEEGCMTTLSTGETIQSEFVIGADGSRSFVRDWFNVPFEVTYPQLIWAVLDGIVDTDFNKVPEIIVFQAETSDVAWIPREGEIDRFYVRMDTQDFTVEQAVAKINRAMAPHTLRFKELVWSSQFTVRESVAQHYAIEGKVFIAGDACHIHSVNGGQGLNTGLADAFNLMWKMSMVLKHGASKALLPTYEQERKPVALGVIETSGELVRTTKYSAQGTHAEDYLKVVERRAGFITGMGIRYGQHDLDGQRLLDFKLREPVSGELTATRIYSLLDYRFFTLLVFSDAPITADLPAYVKQIQINDESSPYANQLILVRPDTYIAASSALNDLAPITAYLDSVVYPRTT